MYVCMSVTGMNREKCDLKSANAFRATDKIVCISDVFAVHARLRSVTGMNREKCDLKVANAKKSQGQNSLYK